MLHKLLLDYLNVQYLYINMIIYLPACFQKWSMIWTIFRIPLSEITSRIWQLCNIFRKFVLILLIVYILFFSPQVCVYINKHGDCGPYLNPQKVQQLPDHFGPGPVNVILRRTVQACVDCAIDSKTVFLFIKPDNRGGELITGILI